MPKKKKSLGQPKVKNWLRNNWVIILILLIGFYVRVDKPYAINFSTDSYLKPSIDFLEGGEIPLIGAEVSGMIDNAQKGPFQTYLYLIPVLFSKNPISLIIFSGLLNTLGILLCYILVRKMFTKKAALIASALIAVHPFQIYYSRILNNLPVLFFFIILFFLAAYYFFVEKKSSYLVLLCLSIGCLIQTHILSAIMILTGFVYLLVYRPQIKVKHVVMGALILILLFSPFIYYEATHGFQNTVNTFNLFSPKISANPEKQPAQNIVLQFLFFNRFLDPTPILQLKDSLNPLYVKAFRGISLLEEEFFLLGLAFLLVLGGLLLAGMIKMRLDEKNKLLCAYSKKIPFLLIWACIPLLAFIILKSPALHRYYIYLFPLHLILLGFCLDLAVESIRNESIRKIANLCVIIFVIAMVLASTLFTVYVNGVVLKTGEIEGKMNLKNKFDLVNLFRNNLSISFRLFDRNVHDTGLLGDWKGGFESLFDYQEKKSMVEAESGKAEHYLLLKKIDAERLISEGLYYEDMLSINNITILEYSPQLNYSSWKMASNNPGSVDWFRQNASLINWSKADFPIYEDRSTENLYLRGTINFNNAYSKIKLKISTRACIERMYINEVLAMINICSRELKMIEISDYKYEIDITPWLQKGKNLVALQLVNIHKAFIVDVYDLSFGENLTEMRQEMYALRRIQKEKNLIDDFGNMTLDGMNIFKSESSNGSIEIVKYNNSRNNYALLIRYGIYGKEPYVLFSRNFLPELQNWSGYGFIRLQMKNDKDNDTRLIFVVVDQDQDQWVYALDQALADNKSTTFLLPIAGFENPDWAEHGNGEKNFDQIKSYQIHLIPKSPDENSNSNKEMMMHSLYLDQVDLIE